MYEKHSVEYYFISTLQECIGQIHKTINWTTGKRFQGLPWYPHIPMFLIQFWDNNGRNLPTLLFDSILP